MRGTLILIAALTVASCASSDRGGLAVLVGESRQLAMDAFGPPLHQRKDGQVMRYRWRAAFVSMEPAGGRTATGAPVCDVFVASDEDGVIRSARMRGDPLACKQWKTPYDLVDKIRNIRAL